MKTPADGIDGLMGAFATKRSTPARRTSRKPKQPKPMHEPAISRAALVPSVAPYIQDADARFVSSTALVYARGYYGALLRQFAMEPCSPTWTGAACPACRSRDALVTNGDLEGVWEVMALLVEVCRG